MCDASYTSFMISHWTRDRSRGPKPDLPFVMSNFSADFLMEEVADKVGLGLRSFMRRFKIANGDTPLNYLQRVRIETARELLHGSSLSIDQIGYRVGYEDVSFFGRLFRRKVGETPGEFRKRVSQGDDP